MCLLETGVKRAATNETPGRRRAFRLSARATPSIQGAPTISNGVSVPRPTESGSTSRKPMPGYRAAWRTLRMLGDGFTHGRPV